MRARQGFFISIFIFFFKKTLVSLRKLVWAVNQKQIKR